MPAKDLYHDAVRSALVRDGWTITDDPLRLKLGRKDMYVDLGASKLLAAQKAERKIAVEIKTFSGKSEMEDLEKALGQYVVYFDVLADQQPDRSLYLAFPIWAYNSLFDEPIGQLLLKNNRLKLIVYEPKQEVIERWIPEP